MMHSIPITPKIKCAVIASSQFFTCLSTRFGQTDSSFLWLPCGSYVCFWERRENSVPFLNCKCKFQTFKFCETVIPRQPLIQLCYWLFRLFSLVVFWNGWITNKYCKKSLNHVHAKRLKKKTYIQYYPTKGWI